jgi:hypothetical protein
MDVQNVTRKLNPVILASVGFVLRLEPSFDDVPAASISVTHLKNWPKENRK